MNRRELLCAGAAASLLPAVPAWAQDCGGGRFEGPLDLRALDDGRRMKLLGAYRFIDGCGKVWHVPKDVEVDGASIPQAFWSVTGGPFEGRYRNASVIHDWFCDTEARPWQQVHRMFLDAMLTAGVGRARANIMYAAVRVGGPRWDRVDAVNAALVERADAVVSQFRIRPREWRGIAGPLGAVVAREPVGGGGPREPAGGSAPPAAPMSEEDFAALARRIEREGLGPEQIDAIAASAGGR